MDPNQNSSTTPDEGQQPTIINPEQPKPADVIQPQTSSQPDTPKVSDISTPAPVAESFMPVQSASDASADTSKPVQPEASTSATHNPLTAPASDSPAVPVRSDLPKKSKSKAKLLAVVVASVVVLLGASAGAYFGVILPNKPENKLMSAFMHMAEQTQTTITGKIDYQSKDGSDKSNAVAVDYTIQANAETKQLSLVGDVGVSGVSLPFEARYIDENMYMKVGGLESIGKLLGGAAGSDESTQKLGETFSAVNDKWFVIDRSMMQGSEESKCSLAVDLKLNDDDMNKIYQAYKKHPIFAVKGQSAADVGGVSTTKFELDPASSDVAKSFTKEIESISIIENLKKCSGESATESLDSTTEDLTKNEEKTQIFVYVTDDKQLKKVELKGEDDKSSVTMTAEFAFGAVKIEKPEGAVPIQDLLATLMGQLSSGGGPTGASGSGLFDAVSL